MQCDATHQEPAGVARRCDLPAGHEGDHQDAWVRWPRERLTVLTPAGPRVVRENQSLSGPTASAHDSLRGFAGQDPALWKGVNPHDYDASQEFSPSGRRSTGRFYEPAAATDLHALREMLKRSGAKFQEHKAEEWLAPKVAAVRKPAVKQLLILAGDIDVSFHFDVDGQLVDVEAAVGVTDFDRIEATLRNAAVNFEASREEGVIVLDGQSGQASSTWQFDVAGGLVSVEHTSLPE